MLRGRSLRMGATLFVAIVAMSSWDQAGISAGVPARTTGNDFETIRPRLRLPERPVPLVGGVPPAAPLEASPPAAAPSRRMRDVAIVPPPRSFERNEVRAPAVPPPAVLRDTRYGENAAAGGTWALVIGINDYPGSRYDLRSAVNDANDVNDTLAKLGVTNDRRLVLRDGQADAATIREGVAWLTAHTAADATMIVFYAGHVQKLDSGHEALVGADGGMVADTELAALLDRSPAKRAWIGIAACYGGGFTEVVRPGRILTAAAPADQLAYENEGFGRSYMVEYMVRRPMLNGSITTVEAAFAFASAELRRDYPNRVPVQDDQFGGDLDLKTPTAPAQPPPASSPAPKSSGESQPPPPPPDEGCAALTAGMVRCY